MLRERLPVVHRGPGTIVLLAGTFAYKWFIGGQAAIRCDEEYTTFCTARTCPVWGPYLLPVHRTRIRNVLRSRRGAAVHGDTRQLYQFVSQRLDAAAGIRTLRPVPELLGKAKLRFALGDSAFANIEPLIDGALGTARLPVGPTHGDLHRGNILLIDGQLCVIDCHRFNPASAPLFDCIHFALTERRLQRRKPWLDLLAESEDLVLCAMDEAGIDRAAPKQVALAYGLNRIAHEGHQSRLRHGVRPKYGEFAIRLLGRYGGVDRSKLAPHAEPARRLHEAGSRGPIFRAGSPPPI